MTGRTLWKKIDYQKKFDYQAISHIRNTSVFPYFNLSVFQDLKFFKTKTF